MFLASKVPWLQKGLSSKDLSDIKVLTHCPSSETESPINLGHIRSYYHVLKIITSESVYICDKRIELGHFWSYLDVLKLVALESVYLFVIPMELVHFRSCDHALKIITSESIFSIHLIGARSFWRYEDALENYCI